MEEICISVKDLYKEYKKTISSPARKVLNGLSMDIRKGDIYGLIGRNGAGKTTFLKCISGVVIPDKGIVEIFGENNPNKLYMVRNRMGALINKPALDEDMSAVDNLKIHAIRRGLSNTDIIEAIANVELLHKTDSRMSDKVRTFSTGMKQRLGIAMAIMGKPELIILDEPLNGLDPDGVILIHNLIRKLNEQGITFIISSHLLRELDEVATRYGILKNGRILSEVSSEKLRACGQSVEDYYMSVTKMI